MESTIELSVLKKEIHFIKRDSLTTGQQRNSMKISFNGKEWNGLTKYGVFKVEDTVKDVLITNSDIEIPTEVCTIDNLGKVVYFGIKGTYTETIDGTETETIYNTPYLDLECLNVAQKSLILNQQNIQHQMLLMQQLKMRADGQLAQVLQIKFLLIPIMRNIGVTKQK